MYKRGCYTAQKENTEKYSSSHVISFLFEFPEIREDEYTEEHQRNLLRHANMIIFLFTPHCEPPKVAKHEVQEATFTLIHSCRLL